MDAAPGTYWRDAPSSGSKLKRPEKSSELLLSEEVLDDLLDDALVEDCLIGFLELEAVFAGCAELAGEQAASVTSERRPIAKKRMFFINTLSNVCASPIRRGFIISTIKEWSKWKQKIPYC